MAENGENMEILEYLDKYNLHEYFSNINPDDYKVLYLKKGEFLLMSGMQQKSIYVFLEGYVRIATLSESGNEIIHGLDKPFDIFGDIECMLNQAINCDIYVKEDSVFLEMKFELVAKHPELYKLLAKRLAVKLQRASRRYTSRVLLDSKTMVTDFITENKEYFADKIVYSEFAKLVSLSERQLRRILTELEEDGIIRKSGKRIYISE